MSGFIGAVFVIVFVVGVVYLMRRGDKAAGGRDGSEQEEANKE